jgi:RNA polymerase sigma-70 factor (ECF subfamily)
MTPVMNASEELKQLQQPMRELHRQFHSLIEPHRPDLYAYCLRLTRSPFDAEDLVQETLTRVFGRLFQLYQPVEPRPYLFRVASNLWIDTCRRAAKIALEPLDDSVPDASVGQERVDEVHDALVRVIELLEPRQRVAVLLKDVFGFSIAEIASFLETTPGAVKGLLHRGRNRIEQQREDAMIAKPGIETLRLAEAYAARLSAEDWDGLAALLREDATVTIVGIDEEHGRDWIRASSFADSEANPLPGNRAEVVFLDDDPVVLWLFQPDDGDEAIRDVVRLSTDGEHVTHVRQYWFCPDVIREVGRRLDRRAKPAGAYTI